MNVFFKHEPRNNALLPSKRPEHPSSHAVGQQELDDQPPDIVNRKLRLGDHTILQHQLLDTNLTVEVLLYRLTKGSETTPTSERQPYDRWSTKNVMRK